MEISTQAARVDLMLAQWFSCIDLRGGGAYIPVVYINNMQRQTDRHFGAFITFFMTFAIWTIR